MEPAEMLSVYSTAPVDWAINENINFGLYKNMSVMSLEGVTKRTGQHCHSIGIYLQEQRMVTRT